MGHIWINIPLRIEILIKIFKIRNIFSDIAIRSECGTRRKKSENLFIDKIFSERHSKVRGIRHNYSKCRFYVSIYGNSVYLRHYFVMLLKLYSDEMLKMKTFVSEKLSARRAFLLMLTSAIVCLRAKFHSARVLGLVRVLWNWSSEWHGWIQRRESFSDYDSQASHRDKFVKFSHEKIF